MTAGIRHWLAATRSGALGVTGDFMPTQPKALRFASRFLRRSVEPRRTLSGAPSAPLRVAANQELISTAFQNSKAAACQAGVFR